MLLTTRQNSSREKVYPLSNIETLSHTHSQSFSPSRNRIFDILDSSVYLILIEKKTGPTISFKNATHTSILEIHATK